MAIANIHDRAAIAGVYPPDAYAGDAAGNDRHQVEVLNGVRIASAADARGDFRLERASHHAGEVPDAAFLAPFHRAAATACADADPDPRGGYEAFLTEIIDTARRHGFRTDEAPGPGDRRLRGTRQ